MKIGLSFDYHNKGAKAAKNDLLSLGKSFLKTTIGVTSASAALYKLNQFMQESVTAALAEQQAVANVNKVLQNNGFGMASKSVNTFVESLQFATGVSEDQLRPAFISLFSALGSVTRAQDTLKVAMDVSAATGRDLSSVIGAITKSASGSNTALSRLGLGIKKTDLAAMSFDDTMALLTKKFGGASAVAAETMKGKLDRIKIASSEAKEAIGTGLLDAFDLLATKGGADLDAVQKKLVDIGTSVGDFERGLGVIIAKLKEAGSIEAGKTSIWSMIWNSIPYLPEITKAYGWVADLGKAERQSAAIGTGGSYFTYKAQLLAEKNAEKERRRLARLAAEEKRRKALEKAQAARDKALAAKKAELDAAANQLQKQFDLERIGLAAALAKQQDADTQKRLQGMMALNDLQYVNNDSLSAMDELLKRIEASFGRMTDAATKASEAERTLAETKLQAAIDESNRLRDALEGVRAKAEAASAAVAAMLTAQYNVGAGRDATYGNPAASLSNISNAQAASALTNLFPEADRASAGSGNYGSYGTTPAPITVNINALSTLDVEEAIAAAVNSGSRAGLSYAQVFSRL